MMLKNYHLITYGCQMNKSDSERIVTIWKKMGLKSTSLENAEVLIFNLCSVRQSAVDRVWGILKNIKKQEYKNKKIILTGCILEADKKKIQDKVDLILDIKDLARWPEIIIKTLKHPSTMLGASKSIKTNNKKYLTVNNQQDSNVTMKQFNNETMGIDYFRIQPHYQSPFSAYVPIMTGCDNFCTYCVVPYTRGREYSRPVEDILQEAKSLAEKGYKEIILLGQNVNSYKGRIKDYLKLFKNLKLKIKNSNVTFPVLLKFIDSIPGDYWLSFITSHPKDMSDELIECFHSCQHLMPYLHLPLQSGSNRILKLMNRGYTPEHYLDLIRTIHKTIRDISISTDIIVGFPGETRAEFQATANMMKKIKFDMTYIAEYSPRSGTAAEKLKDDVSREEKKRRREFLTEILRKTALERNKKLVGEAVDVLIENHKNTESTLRLRSGQAENTENTLIFYGKTKNFKHVKIKPSAPRGACPEQGRRVSPRELMGEFVKVKITQAGPWGLVGKLISVPF